MRYSYSSGKIYALKSAQTDKVYIGSTIRPLKIRLSNHKKDYNRYNQGKGHYKYSNELVKYDDAYIELLEEYSCDNKLQLNRKEGEYMRQYDCVNKNIAGRTLKEWRVDNKEHTKEYYKQYYAKTRIEQLTKVKQKVPCPTCGFMGARVHLKRHIRLKHKS